ncbi:hypothetical protein LPJ59_005372, partial [Coemansia sp. RSA 2399]
MAINEASEQINPPLPPTQSGEQQRSNDDDEWDKRIKRTGCFDENETLLICHADTGDWRKCAKEMLAFKE